MAFGYYSVEILLKVRICRHLRLSKLPKAFEIHNLDSLLLLAGLKDELDQDAPVKTNWNKIKGLVGRVDDLRYGPGSLMKKKDADAFHYCLWESDDGVIPWLNSRL